MCNVERDFIRDDRLTIILMIIVWLTEWIQQSRMLEKQSLQNRTDSFCFFQHNTATTTVLAQIDVFLEIGPEVDNPILKIEKLAQKVLRVIEFIEQKFFSLKDVVETYDLLKDAVSNVESLSNRIIKGEITYNE